MKKLNYLFSFAAMAFAMFMVSCDNVDNPAEPDEPVVPEQKIFDGDELATAIAQYCEVIDGVPTLMLPAGVSVVLNETVELNAPLSIKGDETNPATIKIGAEGGFIGGVQIMNAIIDASEMANPLITFGAEAPEEWTFAYAGFINVTMIGVNKAIVYSGCKNYDAALVVENSLIQIGDVTAFDFTKGSFPIVFSIKNSTFWAPEATTKAFFSSQSGQKANEMEGGTTTFEFENSTFYNLTKGKNFFTHRQSNQTWLTFIVKDCIFVNCGKSGQSIRGLNAGANNAKNPTWDVSGNVFNFDGVDTSAEETTADEDEPIRDSKAVVVNFADADNGDFTQSDTNAGDPTWIK